LIINSLTIGMVALYFHLLRESEKKNREQRDWLQRTARMQELLQMSGHFALKTNGPLDVLGTALHNLEEPLSRSSMDAKVLMAMLAPVESGIQELASVSRSFSLFSRRYLEEGLEQTSLNQVLHHVDTIYNVGAVLRRARLDWKRIEPDILIYTQTAKLVMLMISILRGVGAEGGTKLMVDSSLESDGLHITIQYEVSQDQMAVASDVNIIFDTELNEDLVSELCGELGVERSQGRDGKTRMYRLILMQSRCQARVA
jgi:C4-dicarboxylate-specific signal transduction histidine kinase